MLCPRCGADADEDARRCPACGRGLEIALLQVVDGEVPRTAYFLKPRSYTIGRADESDVALPDTSVSRTHARLDFREGRFFIEDLESRHGVDLGQGRVRRAPLGERATLQLGRVALEFRLLDPEGSTGEATAPARLRPPAVPRSPADAALDHLQIGVALVGRDGAVVFANRSARAILDERDGLGLGPSGLRADDPAVARELRQLLADEGGGTARGGALSVPRRAKPPLALLVVPLGREGDRLAAPAAFKAVFLSDPERGMATSEQTLQRLYRLTPAEARLASELLQGRTLEEAAGQLGITPHTARGQLKSVFGKTGTHRQSELVRLLLAGPAQLRGD